MLAPAQTCRGQAINHLLKYQSSQAIQSIAANNKLAINA
jgi:hypothetical protein